MGPIRVHIGSMPPMLRSIITDLLAAERDVEIVGTGHRESLSVAAVRTEGANILITTESSKGTDPSLAAIIDAQPLTVLVLRPERESCVAVTLTRRELPLDGKNMTDLAEALREATSP
jgi:DNA-binding NarL/FixJ family response regulator